MLKMMLSALQGDDDGENETSTHQNSNNHRQQYTNRYQRGLSRYAFDQNNNSSSNNESSDERQRRRKSDIDRDSSPISNFRKILVQDNDDVNNSKEEEKKDEEEEDRQDGCVSDVDTSTASVVDNNNKTDGILPIPDILKKEQPPRQQQHNDISTSSQQNVVADDNDDEGWEAKIQREIDAANEAASSLLSKKGGRNNSQAKNNNSNSNGKVVAVPSSSSSLPPVIKPIANRPAAVANVVQQPATNDETFHSMDSYEFLQYLALSDPIAKQRLLSFDSKEDIDIVQNRSSTTNLRMEQSIIVSTIETATEADTETTTKNNDNNNVSVVAQEQQQQQQQQQQAAVETNIPPNNEQPDENQKRLEECDDNNDNNSVDTGVSTQRTRKPLHQEESSPSTSITPIIVKSNSNNNDSNDKQKQANPTRAVKKTTTKHPKKKEISCDYYKTSSKNHAKAGLRQSPEKWYRRSRLVEENDGAGEGVNVIADVEGTSSSLIDERLMKIGATFEFEKPPKDRTIIRSKNCSEDGEEKKDESIIRSSMNSSNDNIDDIIDAELQGCLSATESEVASIDGLPSGLQKRWLHGKNPQRQKMLQSLDGVPKKSTKKKRNHHNQKRDSGTSFPPTTFLQRDRRRDDNNNEKNDSNNEDSDGGLFFDCMSGFSSLWGTECTPTKGDFTVGECKPIQTWKEQNDVPLAILDCANLIHQEDRVVAPPVPSSFVRVAGGGDLPYPSYAETILPTEVDPRMQDWIATQFAPRGRPPKDGSYHLGKSKTVIVHEINRGNWTWCTAWSPDGGLLAIATENHHLAVVDTTSSTVWRVRHDRRVRGPTPSNTTHSIRSISWGAQYIAIGGTGNAVSILAPRDPYQILHVIPGTGFVGSLDWLGDSNVLAIGSRIDCVMLVRIKTIDDDDENKQTTKNGRQVESELLHRLDFKYWVNSVAFSPDGSCLAVGDAGGIVSVYEFEETNTHVELNMITWFKRRDSILTVEWSPDGKWLYAGGEDRSVTVIDTAYWEIVHRIGRDRWVQCISASHSGSHVAVGGVSSEISLLDVNHGWDSTMGIELKGLVPLSAKWHPKDQYLALTGQDTTVLAVETTNARHVKGHFLHSISPVLSIEFSPDGRMVAIGNETGVVTFFSLSGTTFITAYELVVPLDNKICTRWSYNGMFVVIGTSSTLMIIGRKRNKRQVKKCPPNASGFFVRKVIRDLGKTNSVSIDFHSHYVAISGNSTRILDVRAEFDVVREWKNGPHYANAWSPDGRWLALLGHDKNLTIYDTSSKRIDIWRAIFSMKCDFSGQALAWGPLIVGGLLYLAYGGDSKEIYIMEIRTHEGTWETVLKIPRDGSINALDWSTEGLLAAGISNGTVTIVDLAYLQSGVAVNEMDYNWQRQALTCFTEIRRNRGENSIKSLRWLPAAPGSDRLLAVGGTDGEVEIIDLTERRRCKGYVRGTT